MGFLQIYRNKRAQQRKFYAYIFSEQFFGENICIKFPLLGSFVAMNLKKPQSRKLSTCQSWINFTLINKRQYFWNKTRYLSTFAADRNLLHKLTHFWHIKNFFWAFFFSWEQFPPGVMYVPTRKHHQKSTNGILTRKVLIFWKASPFV